ncbi:hypothetical protein ZWY2020_018312 [Hordeum vulgare]|nr:hypothetical protein ZWY2020_018312 [Hordeum vulgare]
MDPSGSSSRHGHLLISPSVSTPTFSSTRARPRPTRRTTTAATPPPPQPLLPFPIPASRPHPSGPAAPGPAASLPGFAHNARVAAALAPAVAFLLDLGGAPVLAATYAFDALRLRQGAFFTVWAALLAADVAFFFSASLSSARARRRGLFFPACPVRMDGERESWFSPDRSGPDRFFLEETDWWAISVRKSIYT